MAGRKITLNEAARLKVAVYEYILDNPGTFRHQLIDAFAAAPTDVVAKQLRALAAEGKIRQVDKETGQGPFSRLFPTVEKRPEIDPLEYGSGQKNGLGGTHGDVRIDIPATQP